MDKNETPYRLRYAVASLGLPPTIFTQKVLETVVSEWREGECSQVEDLLAMLFDVDSRMGAEWDSPWRIFLIREVEREMVTTTLGEAAAAMGNPGFGGEFANTPTEAPIGPVLRTRIVAKRW